MLNTPLCELNKMVNVIGIIIAYLSSIEKQLFRVSHFNPAGIALTSFFTGYNQRETRGPGNTRGELDFPNPTSNAIIFIF